MSSSTSKGPAVLAVASFFFAVMATLIGALHGTVPAPQLVMIRFALGAGLVGLWFLARQRGPTLLHWPLLLLRAFFGCGAVLLYAYAIGEIGTGPATILNFISPCYAALFAPLFLNEKTNRWVMAGLAVATAGAVLVALGTGSQGRPLTAMGLGAGVLSGVMSGAATTSLRGLRRSTDALTVYFAFCVIGMLLSSPLAALQWVPMDDVAWTLVLAMSVASLIGQLLHTWALGFTPTVTAGVANQLAPVFSFVLAVVFLHDRPNALTLTGASVCILGVLLGLRAPAVETPGEG